MSEAPPELEIRAPKHRDEVAFANELMAKAHRGNYYDSLRKVQSHAGYPNHRAEYTRLAYWGGELAGTLRITEDTIRLGEARLRMGGLGWVSTAEVHRHKGIARELVADTMNYLRARGYPRGDAVWHPQFLPPLRLCDGRLGEYEVGVSDRVDALGCPLTPQYRMRASSSRATSRRSSVCTIFPI
jgi:GNAT superfamily N-acetyltransferase